MKEIKKLEEWLKDRAETAINLAKEEKRLEHYNESHDYLVRYDIYQDVIYKLNELKLI